MDAAVYRPVYTAFLVSKSAGKKYNLSRVTTDLTLSEDENGIAQEVRLEFANIKTDDGSYLTGVIGLGDKVFIYADDSEKKEEVFRGVVWDIDYDSDIAKRISITAYDNLIYMQESEDSFYFPAGKATNTIFQTICDKWGIQLNYQYYSTTHSKLPIRSDTLSNIFIDRLKSVKKVCGKNYVIRSVEDVMIVNYSGKNTTVYEFKRGENGNTLVVSSKKSLSGVVTKVVITGKEDANDRTPIEATVTGETGTWGTLQRVLSRDEGTTLAEAKTEAQEMINDGKPKTKHTISTIDVPWVHKGDTVNIAAGDLSGSFIVLGITHDANKKIMTMEVE